MRRIAASRPAGALLNGLLKRRVLRPVRVAQRRTARRFAVLLRRFSPADNIPTLKYGGYRVGYTRQWRQADLRYRFRSLVCFGRYKCSDFRSELGPSHSGVSDPGSKFVP